MAKLTITAAGNMVTVSDGKITRQSLCSTPGSAKALATKLTNDTGMVAKWMRKPEPVRLVRPLKEPSAQRDIETAITAKA